MSQPIEIVLGEIYCVTALRDSIGRDITVSQSILMAVGIDIDCFWRDITVSQPIETFLGETSLCHSQ